MDFNPRAHEGHDKRLPDLRAVPYDFNPRAHEGHDQVPLHKYLNVVISIHVPTRGTTQAARWGLSVMYFNPRAHEGHDVWK